MLDEARAQIYVDAAAARLSFKSVRVMPYLKSSWTAWKAALVTEAKLCDGDGVRRLLEWGKSTFPAAAPEHLPELQAIVASLEATGSCGPLSRLPFDDDIRGHSGRAAAGGGEGDDFAAVGNVSSLVSRPSSSLDVSSASEAGPGHHATALQPQAPLQAPSAVSTSFSGRPALSGAALRVPRSQVLAAAAAAASSGSGSVDVPEGGHSAANASFEPLEDASFGLPSVNTSITGDAGAAEAAAAAAFMRAVATRRRATLLAGGAGAGAGFFPTLSPVRERQGATEGAGSGAAGGLGNGRPSTGSHMSGSDGNAASPAASPPLAHIDDLAVLETSMNITHTRGGRRRAPAAAAAPARFSLQEADQSTTYSGGGGSGSSRASTSTAGSTTSGSSVSQYSFGSGGLTGTDASVNPPTGTLHGGGFVGSFNVTTTAGTTFGHTGHGALASSVLAASTGFPGHNAAAVTATAVNHVPSQPEAAGAVAGLPLPAPPHTSMAPAAAPPPPPSTVKKRKGVAFEVPDYIKNFGIKPVAAAAGGQAPPAARPAVPASPAPRVAAAAAALGGPAGTLPNPRALPPWQPTSFAASAAPRGAEAAEAPLPQPPPAKRPRLEAAAAEERRPADTSVVGGDAMMVEDADEVVLRVGEPKPLGRAGAGAAPRVAVPHTPAPAAAAAATSHDDSDLLISPIVLKEAPSVLKTNLKAPPSAIAASQPPSAARPFGGPSPSRHARLGGGAASLPFPSLEDEFTRQLAKAATAAAEAANASIETTRDEDEEDASEAGRPLQPPAAGLGAGRQGPASQAQPLQRVAAAAPAPAAAEAAGSHAWAAPDERGAGAAAAAASAPSALFDPLAAAVPGAEVVRVGGRAFLKLDCIGRGGSSRVYRVLSQDMVIYALKRVRLARMDAATIAQYSNEIGLLRRLAGHKHIIKLIAADVSYGTKCIHMVMELGQTDLAKMLQEEASKGAGAPRLPGVPAPAPAPTVDAEGYVVPVVDENLLRLMWQQMLIGVQTIHESRIVHGDLKPANFVVVEGILKLIDFGIAKAISNDTTNIVRDTQMGTLNYMSPEAIMDVSGGGGGGGGSAAPTLRLGRASDIWSLGCILYQMVYGRTPFAELSLISKLHAICDARHVIPFPPVRDPHLVDVMRSCLTRDPTKRLPIGGPGGLLLHPFLRPHLAPAAPQPVLPDAATLTRLVKAVAGALGGQGLPEEAAEAAGTSVLRVLVAGLGGSAPAALPPPPPGALETAVKEALGAAPLFAPPPLAARSALTAAGHALHASVASAVRGAAAEAHKVGYAHAHHPPYAAPHAGYMSGPVTDENAPMFGGAHKLMPPQPALLHHQQQHQSLLPGSGALKSSYPLG